MLLGLVMGASAGAQAPVASLSFHYERAGLPVPEYTLTVHPDGTGTYVATYAAPQAATSRYGGTDASAAQHQASAAPITVPFTLSVATTAKLFESVRRVGYFHAGCESKEKNIADSGKKQYHFEGPDGAGDCVYNYTENKVIAAMTETMMGLAFTLDEGRTLEMDRRYDRLALDARMSQLVEAVKSGQAVELGVIATTLRGIADDPQVLDRVRSRATRLLASSGTAR